VKSQTLAGLQQRYASTEGIAADVFNRALFDPNSAFARPVEGVKTTLSQLTKQDVQDYYNRMYGPANTTVLLVGDVDAATARRVLDRSLGSWTSAAKKADPASARNVVRRVDKPRVILIDRPGSVQSSIRVGLTTTEASDPDYIPLLALNRVLGGGGDARMGTNLRERHSFTYGANTALNLRRGPGTWYLASQVRTNATDSALVEAMGEYRRIVNEMVPGEELSGNIGSLVGSFPNSVQTVQGLAGRLQTLLTTGMPIDFYSTYREKLSALTPAEIGRVAKKHLAVDKMTILVVGDLSKIEQPIRARNFGDVEVWDVEGNKLR
jgi:zinc protease